MSSEWDVIVVGARCAGATTAARLARGGMRVLLLDRDSFPSSVHSTHAVFPNTVARLERLGALDEIRSKHTLRFQDWSVRVMGYGTAGRFTPIAGFDQIIAPTREVLDQALITCAQKAGVEVRLSTKVVGLIGSGSAEDPVCGVHTASGERLKARWVIGADGRSSTVAALLALPKLQELQGQVAVLYAYWRGLPQIGTAYNEATDRKILSWWACQDDIQLVAMMLPPELVKGNQTQRRATYLEQLKTFSYRLKPQWIEQATLVGKVLAAPETMLRGFFRQAYGNGWALVGDAGHMKHIATGQGIGDAIAQAEHLAKCLLQSGQSLDSYGSWLSEYSAEHYQWSFDWGRWPKAEIAIPIYSGIESDSQASQDLLDTFTRRIAPSQLLTDKRLTTWFSERPKDIMGVT